MNSATSQEAARQLALLSNKNLPIKCFNLDHYTLIVPNAKKVADFHEKVLGYELINTICVNAGSAPAGKYDMLNYVMTWPNSEKGVLVITEGLTKESIFYKFLQKYGQGIHHIAFEIEDIEFNFKLLKEIGIELTSESLLRDPLTGLRQFFISNIYTGVFIELIERKSSTNDKITEERGFFTEDNMSGLASTMKSYLDDPAMKEDANIKALDNHQYFSSIKTIKTESIHSFNVISDKVKEAELFFKKILGFQNQNNRLVNPQETEKAIVISGRGETKENVMPIKMALNTKGLDNTLDIMDNLNLEYKVDGQNIILDEAYSGYPITLIHE